MNEKELNELPVERVTLVPAGSTLIFQAHSTTTDVQMRIIAESIDKHLPDHKCVLLRDAKLFAAIERPLL